MKLPPTPRKAPRQVRSHKMVEAILAASARVLAQRGYAGMNTNVVAEQAGVSIGSVYQYFPNKDALIAALHERHGRQMSQVIDAVLAGSARASLREHVAAITRALLAAHMVEPDLHRVLEAELPFFDAPQGQSQVDKGVFGRVRDLLEARRSEIVPQNRDLATWVVLKIIVSLVHAAVIDPPAQFVTVEIERAISESVMGYLTGAAA